MKTKIILSIIILLFILSCVEKPKKSVEPQSTEKSSYFDYSNSDDQVTGGINMIPITAINPMTLRFGPHNILLKK